MLVPRQFAQHALSVGRVVGLAIDGSTQGHGGIRAEDGRSGQTTARMPGHGGIELEARYALHVGWGRFAGQHRFNGLRVFGLVAMRIGQQQFVMHAQLFEQLAAAWALGCEVDEVGHKQIIGAADTTLPASSPHVVVLLARVVTQHLARTALV